jgi:hypothetical protein
MKIFKRQPRVSIVKEEPDGKEVLRKTEDFKLYVIRKSSDDSILGTVLLTTAQFHILNESCNAQGIKFTER